MSVATVGWVVLNLDGVDILLRAASIDTGPEGDRIVATSLNPAKREMRGTRMADNDAAEIAERLEKDSAIDGRESLRADVDVLLADRAHLIMLLSDRIADSALAEEAKARERARCAKIAEADAEAIDKRQEKSMPRDDRVALANQSLAARRIALAIHAGT